MAHEDEFEVYQYYGTFFTKQPFDDKLQKVAVDAAGRQLTAAELLVVSEFWKDAELEFHMAVLDLRNEKHPPPFNIPKRWADHMLAELEKIYKDATTRSRSRLSELRRIVKWCSKKSSARPGSQRLALGAEMSIELADKINVKRRVGFVLFSIIAREAGFPLVLKGKSGAEGPSIKALRSYANKRFGKENVDR